MQMIVNVNYLVHMMQTCKCMRRKADFSSLLMVLLILVNRRSLLICLKQLLGKSKGEYHFHKPAENGLEFHGLMM